MWYLTIPIPNWTGYVLGFVSGFLVWFGWCVWLYRREKKRLAETEKQVEDAFKKINPWGHFEEKEKQTD